MSVPVSQITVDGYYLDKGGRVRHVIKVEGDRVHYRTRKGKFTAGFFPKTYKPTIEAFAKAVVRSVPKSYDPDYDHSNDNR